MKVYTDTSAEAVSDEEALIESVALLGQDDQSVPYSWTGIRNSDGRLRLILECFGIEQDRNLTELLRASGWVHSRRAEHEGTFIDGVAKLDQVFCRAQH